MANLSGALRTNGWRLYQDFLMPQRFDDYRKLLARAREQGYEIISVDQWAQRVQRAAPLKSERLLILRHDVDTDAAQTPLTCAIEREFGASASYFFRLSTMNERVVRQVADMGFHVSYHYEELATVAKRLKLKNADEVHSRMPIIRAEFADNLQRLRQQFSLPMRLVCSHGDWINRRLKIANHALLADSNFRQQIGVDFETYDTALIEPLKAYVSDYPAPEWWRPRAPQNHLQDGDSPLAILMHPRQWRPTIRNTGEYLQRISEGLTYRWSR